MLLFSQPTKTWLPGTLASPGRFERPAGALPLRTRSVVVLLPDINLLSVMLTAQLVNGIILPVLLAFMAIIAADKRIMGAYRSRLVSRVLVWGTVGVVAVLTVALFAMQLLGVA